MPGRKYTLGKGYRYGFNGKENDNEVKGEGNQQDYGMRIYDPRLGRFLSTDPLTKQYPCYTPYQFAGNKPIKYVDLDGAEEGNPEEEVDENDVFWERFNENLRARNEEAEREENLRLFNNRRPQFDPARQFLSPWQQFINSLSRLSRSYSEASVQATSSMLHYNYGPLFQSFPRQTQLMLPAPPPITSYVGKGVSSENLKAFTEELQKAAETSSAPIEKLEVLAQGSMDKFIILGRNQDARIDIFANELIKKGINVETIKKDLPDGPGNPGTNIQWLQLKHSQGYSIIDIGLDPAFTKDGNMDEGAFYGAERALNSRVTWQGKSSISVNQSTKKP